MMLLVYVNVPVTSTGWSPVGAAAADDAPADAARDGAADVLADARADADGRADALGEADVAMLGCVWVLIVGEADGSVANVGVGAALCWATGVVAEHAANAAPIVTTSSGRTARWKEDRLVTGMFFLLSSRHPRTNDAQPR